MAVCETKEGRVGTESDTMEEYRTYVRRVAKKSNGQEVIQNKTRAHASILLAALFDKAERNVEVVLDDDVFAVPDVIEAAVSFLTERHGKMRVVIEQELASSGFLSALKDRNATDRVEVFVAPHDLVELYPFRFVIADGKHYRFQADRKKFDAIAQFGSDTGGLEKAYKAILSHATPYRPL